jgi:hypothetical protein
MGEGVEVHRHTLLTSALHAFERSILCPGHFTLQEIHPATYWIGLDGWAPDLGKTDKPFSIPETQPRNPNFRICPTVTTLTGLSRLPVL